MKPLGELLWIAAEGNKTQWDRKWNDLGRYFVTFGTNSRANLPRSLLSLQRIFPEQLDSEERDVSLASLIYNPPRCCGVRHVLCRS
jgi:hypothetical protein